MLSKSSDILKSWIDRNKNNNNNNNNNNNKFKLQILDFGGLSDSNIQAFSNANFTIASVWFKKFCLISRIE